MFAARNSDKMQIKDASGHNPIARRIEPVTYTLLVEGELDMLFKFYEMYKEPQTVSEKFVYSWVATKSSSRKAKTFASLTDSLCAHYANLLIQNNLTEQAKENLIQTIPKELWQRIFSHIPLSKLRLLLNLAQQLENATSQRITRQEVIQWKLREEGLLLFEFNCESSMESVRQLPMLKRWRAFFPSLKFILRSTKVVSKMPIDKAGESTLKVLEENYQLYSNENETEYVQHYEVTETKKGSQVKQLIQSVVDMRPQELQQNQYLFRETSKMATSRGNTAPNTHQWYPVFSANSIDVFYQTSSV